jgi:phosphate transport system permease protein
MGRKNVITLFNALKAIPSPFNSTTSKKSDRRIFFLFSSIITVAIIVFLVGFIFYEAMPVFLDQGIGFFINSKWDYDTDEYGLFIFLTGTLVLTGMTMAMTLPLGVLTAIFLAEFCPGWLKGVLRPMIELLVGIPSIVYGIFGVFVLTNIFKYHIDPFIDATLGFIPIFARVVTEGQHMLLASVVLTVMVLPTMTVITEESIRAISRELREGSFALGATRWETVKKLLIPLALPGIAAAFILSMMRAMGETMAVLMLTGGLTKIPTSILDAGSVMTTRIVADIGYYISFDMARSALFGIAATLFMMEILLVGVVRLISRKKI